MKNLLLLNISYQGQNYAGFERQKDSETIKSIFCKLIDRNWSPKKLLVYCTSRTDAKVHALDQYILINSEIDFNKNNVVQVLKHQLPKDITIKRSMMAPKGFDLVNGTDYKEYRYLFCITDKEIPIHPFYTAFQSPIDFNLIKLACTKFIGRHNFFNFQYRSKSPDMHREIFECELLKSSQFYFNSNYPDLPFYEIRVIGEGFMRHMVRLMVGALINIGQGVSTIEDLDRALIEKGSECAFIAPPQGLYQYQTYFPILENCVWSE